MSRMSLAPSLAVALLVAGAALVGCAPAAETPAAPDPTESVEETPVAETGPCPPEVIDLVLNGGFGETVTGFSVEPIDVGEFFLPEVGADVLADACIFRGTFDGVTEPGTVVTQDTALVPASDEAAVTALATEVGAALTAAGFVGQPSDMGGTFYSNADGTKTVFVSEMDGYGAYEFLGPFLTLGQSVRY